MNLAIAKLLILVNLFLPNAIPQGFIYSGSTAAAAWTPSVKTCIGQGGSSATTASCTPSSNFAAGESLFCVGIVYSNGVTMTMTDSHSDTFTSAGSQYGISGFSSTGGIQIFRSFTLPATVTSVTLNLSPATGYPTIQCQSATDSGMSPAQDGVQCTGSVVGAATPIPCTTPASGLLSPTANDYIFVFGAALTQSLSAASGYTAGSSIAANYLNEYRVTSGTTTPSVVPASIDNGDIIAAMFKP